MAIWFTKNQRKAEQKRRKNFYDPLYCLTHEKEYNEWLERFKIFDFFRKSEEEEPPEEEYRIESVIFMNMVSSRKAIWIAVIYLFSLVFMLNAVWTAPTEDEYRRYLHFKEIERKVREYEQNELLMIFLKASSKSSSLEGKIASQVEKIKEQEYQKNREEFHTLLPLYNNIKYNFLDRFFLRFNLNERIIISCGLFIWCIIIAFFIVESPAYLRDYFKKFLLWYRSKFQKEPMETSIYTLTTILSLIFMIFIGPSRFIEFFGLQKECIVGYEQRAYSKLSESDSREIQKNLGVHFKKCPYSTETDLTQELLKMYYTMPPKLKKLWSRDESFRYLLRNILKSILYLSGYLASLAYIFLWVPFVISSLLVLLFMILGETILRVCSRIEKWLGSHGNKPKVKIIKINLIKEVKS